jgi:hypothetical protein
MIIINLLGAVMIFVGFLAGLAIYGLATQQTRDEELPMALGIGIAMAVMGGVDFWYRWKHYREQRILRYLSPVTGGSLWFIPVWVFFGVGPYVGVMVWVIGRKLGLGWD